MEDFRSHAKRCDVTREHLDEWYSHRIKVEAELSKLAWHFEKWGQESDSRTAASSTAGKSKNTGAEQQNTTVKWMDFVVELLENDRILSDRLFNSIIELQTNEAVLSFKIHCGVLDGEARNSPTENRPRNSATEHSYSDNVEFLLRQKVKTPLLLNAVGALAISVPWHLAEVVKHMKDFAGGDRRSRCETAKLLHVFAASAKVQREEVRSSIMEYLDE